MQPEHRIDELIVDLSFTTTRLARHEKALLSDWLSEDLLPALDKLFSHYSPGQQILRFETLEFDFGNLTSRNYQQMICEQLLQKFAQLLQTQLLAVAPTNPRLPVYAGSGDNQNTRVALTQLFNYLATGQLSAHRPFDEKTKLINSEAAKSTAVNQRAVKDDAVKDSVVKDNTVKNTIVKNSTTEDNDVKDSKDTNSFVKGIVPKEHTAKQAALHEQLLDAVIAQQNIAELLRELPQRDLLIQRLLSQFSVPQRLELLRQLAPQHLQNTIALLDLLQFFATNNFNADFSSLNQSSFNSHFENGHVKNRIIENDFIRNNLKQVDIKQAGISNHNDALQSLVWQALLHLGLEYPQATETFWLNYILGKVSDLLAINETLLTQYLSAIKVPASPAATPLANLQTKIAQLSKNQNTTAGNEFPQENYNNESNSLDIGQQKNPEQLRQLIAAAFIRADASQLQQLWPQLIAGEPQLLLSALKHYLSQAEIRQQLMMYFPLALQADIIVFLAPTIKSLFSQLQNKVSELIELIHLQSNDKARWVDVNRLPPMEHDNQQNPSTRESTLSSNNIIVTGDDSPELFRRRLWEIAVGLILENCSVAPDSKYTGNADSFLMMLAAHYAELHSLNAPILQQAWSWLLLDKQESNAFDNKAFDSQAFNSQSDHIESDNKLLPLHEQQLTPLVAATVWDAYETHSGKMQRDLEQQKNSQPLTLQTEKSSLISDSALLEQATESGFVDLNKTLANQENLSPAVNLGADLAGISDHQLFDLCLRLKSGALTWAQLSHNVELLQRLINSYIRLGHSATAENCADFVAAIDAQATLTNSAATFYLVVLQTLIADKLVDLDAIAIAVKNNFNPPPAQHLSSVLDEQELISTSDTGNPVIAKTPQLEALVLQLQQGKVQPDSLDLSSEKFAELVNIFISTDKTIALDIQADLITAIQQHAQQVNRKADYYRRVLILLVYKETMDLIDICKQVNNHDEPKQYIAYNKSHENEMNTAQQSTQVANEQLVLESAASSSITTEKSPDQAINQEIIPQPSPLPITQADNIAAIAQTLLSEMQPSARLQTLHLDSAQWQQLAVELIQQAPFVDKDSSTELIAAIQNQSRQVINPVAYYRLVIEAVLKHQSIDLEAFAATAMAANSEQQTAINNPRKGLTDEVGVAGFSNSHPNQNNSPLAPVQKDVTSSSITSEINPNQEINKEIIPQFPPTPITQIGSIAEIAQVLLSEMQPSARFQTLRLDAAQWQRLTVELIQQAEFIDKDSKAGLIGAIQTHARQAINTSVYYRLVIAAVLKHQPINLEAFAVTAIATTADNEQQTAINNPLNDLTDEVGVAGFSNSYPNQNNSPLAPVQKDVTSSSITSEINPNQEINKEIIPQFPPTPITHTGSIVEIAQTLLSEMQPTVRLQTLRLDTAQWQKLTIELIQQTEFIDKDSKVGLIGAIQTHARQAINTSVYYRLVIEAVLKHQPIDLEAFTVTAIATTANSEQQVAINNPRNGLTDEVGVAGFSNSHPNQNNSPLAPVQKDAASSSITSEINPNQAVNKEIIPQFPPTPITQTGSIVEIAQALLLEMQPTVRLQTLRLDAAQWQRLMVELIQQAEFIDKDSKAGLIGAIQTHARQAINTSVYYRLVIAAVLKHQPIDLEAFAATAMAANSEQQAAINNHLNNLADEAGVTGFVNNKNSSQKQSGIAKNTSEPTKDSLQFTENDNSFASAENSSTELIKNQILANPQNNSQRFAVPITATTSTQIVAQTLLAEPQSWVHLQYLRLEDAQWKKLLIALIQQTPFVEASSNSELIEAIQTQARQAINASVYYRLVINAVLQKQPIDLEAFAATAIDKEQTPAIDNAGLDSTDIVEVVAIADAYNNKPLSQVDSGQFTAEQINAKQFNTDQIQSGQFNSEQSMDYSLLTGSDHSLYRPVLSLAQLLAAELPLGQEQLLTLQQHINTLLNRPNQALITEWRELLVVMQHAQVFIHSVPAHLLHQIVMRLYADRYVWLDAVVKVVMEALALLVADINNLTIKQVRWEFIFNYLFASDSTKSEATETSARALELSIELCAQLASATGIGDVQRLVNLTQRRIALLKPPAQQKPAMRLQDITTNPATHSDASSPQWEAGLHINNAGQVLVAAFLPRLFSMLNLMQDGKFIHLGAADRAVHLVQFMVTGQSATPEYELILNKILCGIGTSIPVSAGIDITEQEQTLIEQMLNSMIQHWKVLGSTSITGLRETFFQRQGWLVLEEDCWRLKVKEQTFDLLLDRLPWSISLIKHGWMDKPLRVSWRNHS